MNHNETFKRIWGIPRLMRSLCLLFVFLPGIFSKIHSQEKDYAIQANIIYHFTKYIDWPANRKSGDFIIGVIGNTSLYNAMKENMSGKTVGRQNIVIKKMSSRETSFVCHILFVGEDEGTGLKKIALQTTGLPMLLVSEEEGLALKGSCINFIVVADHLKLEINKNNIEQRNLHIASELLQLGTIIK